MGGTVVRWFALSPHSKQTQMSISRHRKWMDGWVLVRIRDSVMCSIYQSPRKDSTVRTCVLH